MDNEDKLIVYVILKNTGFYSMRHKKGKQSARLKDALYNLPREIAKVRNPPLPAIENESDNLQGEGVKIIIPSNIIDIYTRLEILLGLKLSGHTDTLTEASNVVDELYKRGEIQNKQQYRNALNKFKIYIHTIILVYILNILTLIRVVIHSLKLCDTNNYMSINTRVYIQLYVFNI